MRLLCILALAALPMLAQAPPWEVGLQFIPSATSTVAWQTVHVQQMTLVNTSGSAVTVTVADRSINCNGGACTVFSAAVPANTTYTVAIGGARATNGLT